MSDLRHQNLDDEITTIAKIVAAEISGIHHEDVTPDESDYTIARSIRKTLGYEVDHWLSAN